MDSLKAKMWSVMIIFLVFYTFPLSGADVGTTTAEFLKIKPEAYAAGMGEAYSAIASGTGALTYNPAGLGALDRSEITGTGLLWFNDINMAHIAGAISLERGLGVGAGLLWIDFGSFNSTGISTIESVDLKNGVLSFGIGKSIGESIHLGLGAKVLYESFMGEHSAGFSFDAGALFNIVGRNLNAAVTAKNIGRMFGVNDMLPMEVSAGLAFRLFNGRHDYLNACVDVSKILTTDNLFFGAGIEGTFFNAVSLRLGFRHNNALDLDGASFSDIASMMNLSAGVGVIIGDAMALDYSLTPMGDLGTIQRVGLRFVFGESHYENMMAEKNARVEPKAMEVPEIRVEGDRIERVSFRPNVPDEKVKEWSLSIKTSDGMIVKTFSGVGEVPKNLTWDGTDSFGKIAKAGVNYIFDFKAKDKDNQIIKTAGQIVPPQKLAFIEIKEARYAPAKNKKMLVVPAAMLVSSDPQERKVVPFVVENDKMRDVKAWSFEIFDGVGRQLKRFEGERAMPSYLIWDGKDSAGRLVENMKDCRYELVLAGADGKEEKITSKKTMRAPFSVISKEKKMSLAPKIYYAQDSSELRPEMEARIKGIAAEIKALRNAQVYIQGHASNEGDRTRNAMLSRERAKSVLRQLVEKHGISPLSITTTGYGADIPASYGNTDEARQMNRRVEIIIMGERQ